jgi:mannose-6-phosphate isomerase-like protein (cupin superfamily)
VTKPDKIRSVRRIITGHDSEGRSTIISDAPSPHSMTLSGVETFGVTDLWKTASAPADNATFADPCSSVITLAPPASGTVLRLVEFPPDKDYIGRWKRAEAFASMGTSGAQAIDDSAARHEAMHRTASVDYAIVIEGEICAVLDTTETIMRPGDFLIQRGTNHAWSNRSDKPALVAFVLIDAKSLNPASDARTEE